MLLKAIICHLYTASKPLRDYWESSQILFMCSNVTNQLLPLFFLNWFPKTLSQNKMLVCDPNLRPPGLPVVQHDQKCPTCCTDRFAWTRLVSFLKVGGGSVNSFTSDSPCLDHFHPSFSETPTKSFQGDFDCWQEIQSFSWSCFESPAPKPSRDTEFMTVMDVRLQEPLNLMNHHPSLESTQIFVTNL